MHRPRNMNTLPATVSAKQKPFAENNNTFTPPPLTLFNHLFAVASHRSNKVAGGVAFFARNSIFYLFIYEPALFPHAYAAERAPNTLMIMADHISRTNVGAGNRPTRNLPCTESKAVSPYPTVTQESSTTKTSLLFI